MADINSVNVSNTDYVMSGVNTIISCTTAVGTTAKTATVPKGFTLDSGVSFLIKFTNGNTATSPTLTLTPEGGSALTTKNLVGTSGNNTLTANIIYTCHYNGTNFTIDNNCTSHMNNKNNPHNVTKTSVGLGSVVNRGLDSNASTTSTNYIQNNVATSIANGAICTETNPNTYYKEVSISGFTLFQGAIVRVLFQHGNTATKPTLDVSNTGAKNIVVRRNNKFYFPATHTGYWDGSTTTSTRMWDNYVTLELMYIAGTQTVYNPSDDTSSSVNGVWLIMGNPVVNSYFGTDSGYTVYANGLIEQWRHLSTTDTYQTEIPFTFLVDFSSTPKCFGAINRRDSNFPSGTLSIYKLTPEGGSLRVIVSDVYSTSTHYAIFAIGY